MGTKITGVHDLQYAWFKRKYFELSGIALDSYKDSQMMRRIASFMQNKDFKNYVQFYKSLEKEKKLAEDFKNFLTINVSSFFRDSEKWKELAEDYLPEILKKHAFLQIWSAGCSIGCEPYTLSMVCETLKSKSTFSYSITATDIDENAVLQARAGIYTMDCLKDVEEDVVTTYFASYGSKQWKVKPLLQKNIAFQVRDLLKGGDEKRYHLILCRNVVIYFDDEAKLKLYQLFSDSLFSGGILFTGGSEIIFQSESIGLKNLSMSFYQKI